MCADLCAVGEGKLAAVALVFDEHDHAGNSNKDWPDNIHRTFCEQTLVLKQETNRKQNNQDWQNGVMSV